MQSCTYPYNCSQCCNCVCGCRDGAGWLTIQSVGSNHDHLVLRDRTSFDRSNRLVAAELETDSKGLVFPVVTVHILLLVSDSMSG